MSELKNKLKNVTTGKTFITSLLQKYKENDIVDDPEILELISYHPTKHINRDNVDYLVMKRRPPFNKLALFYKYKNNDKFDDISYILCIKNLFGKYNRDECYEADVMSAFRCASHFGTKTQFFVLNAKLDNNAFMGECNNCHITTNDITTDHYPIPFKQIFERFCQANNITLSAVDIFENENNELRLSDSNLASRWQLFHDSIAHIGCCVNRVIVILGRMHMHNVKLSQ